MHRQDTRLAPRNLVLSPTLHAQLQAATKPPQGYLITPSPNIKIVIIPLTRFNMALGDLAFFFPHPPGIRDPGARRSDTHFFLTPPRAGDCFLLPNQSGSVRLRSRHTGSTGTTKLHWFSLVSNSGAPGLRGKKRFCLSNA